VLLKALLLKLHQVKRNKVTFTFKKPAPIGAGFFYAISIRLFAILS
jgi:hypothetical protein